MGRRPDGRRVRDRSGRAPVAPPDKRGGGVEAHPGALRRTSPGLTRAASAASGAVAVGCRGGWHGHSLLKWPCKPSAPTRPARGRATRTHACGCTLECGGGPPDQFGKRAAVRARTVPCGAEPQEPANGGGPNGQKGLGYLRSTPDIWTGRCRAHLGVAIASLARTCRDSWHDRLWIRTPACMERDPVLFGKLVEGSCEGSRCVPAACRLRLLDWARGAPRDGAAFARGRDRLAGRMCSAS